MTAQPLAQNYTVVLHTPDDRLYVDGPGLVRLDDGTLVAVVPVVPRGKALKSGEAQLIGDSAVHILGSHDGGATWQPLSELPYYSAAPWVHNGQLYLFAFEPGSTHRNDDMHLLRSDDGGRTWTDPVVLFTGHYWNVQTGMVLRDNHLYWAVDDLAEGTNNEHRTQRAVVGDLTGDPMDPAAWRLSNAVPFPGVPPGLSNPRFSGATSKCLEPNVLEVGGRLTMLTAAKIEEQNTVGLCTVVEITDDGRNLHAKFVQYYPMLGGQMKFCTLWDPEAGLFWATANQVTDSQRRLDWWDTPDGEPPLRCVGGNERRFLMLSYSADGLNWFMAGCIARGRSLVNSFMYATQIVDGEDLVLVARSNLGRKDAHDADHATFHRVPRFRDLALDLHPGREP